MLPWVILLLVPFAAHLPELGRLLTSNPFYYTSGLLSSVPDFLIPGSGWNDPNVGYTTQALGGLAARQWLSGSVPWWNPYSGVGLPLAAEMQNSALFLPFVLLLRAFDGVLYLKIVMQVIAGWATFALLRQLAINRAIALLGGILFELNGTFAWLADAPIMPVAFLPLLLLGIERAFSHAQRRLPGGWSWITAAIAYSLYAGFPETAFLDGLMALAWALVRLPAGGWHFIAKLALAGALGVMLAAPVILPFAEFLALAYTGVHGVQLALPPPNYAMLAFPYLYGSNSFDGRWLVWGLAGGYLPLSICTLACLAVLQLADGRRIMLAAWILVAMAKAANLPGLSQILDFIPFMHEIWVSRYVLPSCEMAGLLLAAFALNDWRCVRPAGRLRSWFTVAIAAVAVIPALVAALPLIDEILQGQPAYPLFVAASLTSAVAVTAGAVVLTALPWSPWRGVALCSLLAVESFTLFVVPLLTAMHAPTTDRAAIAFLRENLGFSRFYTVGPFLPNYSAMFAIASINHNYLPVPRLWVDYIRTHLDPGANDVGFNGQFPAAPPGGETRVDALRRRMAAYASIGVKYVLTPPGMDPFIETSGPPTPAGRPIVHELSPGQDLSGVMRGDDVRAGTLESIAVSIGSNHGAADGMLAVRLCAESGCAEGSADLRAAEDDRPATVKLTNVLAVRRGESLHYRIAHVGGDHSVAVYSWPSLDNEPNLLLSYSTPPSRPARVFGDNTVFIYELSNVAAYFEVSGSACDLHVASRLEISADCSAPATLIRHELNFPTWTARVNGSDAAITTTSEIFQSIALPAGPSRVAFAYAPPCIDGAYAAFAIALTAFLGSPFIRHLRRPPEQ
jgi:hypothetical protein